MSVVQWVNVIDVREFIMGFLVHWDYRNLMDQFLFLGIFRVYMCFCLVRSLTHSSYVQHFKYSSTSIQLLALTVIGHF